MPLSDEVMNTTETTTGENQQQQHPPSATVATPLVVSTPVPNKKLQQQLPSSVSSELTSFASGSSNTKQQRLGNTVAGNIHGTYPCEWKNYHGSLVVGHQAIVFTGSFFLFEKTLILPWDNIRRVELTDETTSTTAGAPIVSNSQQQPQNTMNNKNIIAVIVSDDTVHSFYNMHAPDKIWLLLLTLHNDALLGRHATTNAAPFTPPRLHRRRNSDPSSRSSLVISSMDDDADAADTTIIEATASSAATEVYDLQQPPYQTPPPSSLHHRPVVSTYTSMSESVPQGTIESSTGRLKLQPIQCMYDGIAGRLYAGQYAIYFTGKRYFWEHTTIMIPWTTIRQIYITSSSSPATPTSATPTNSDDSGSKVGGLTILTKVPAVQTDGGAMDSDETTFVFSSIETPENVRASLIALQNESLRSSPASQQHNAPTAAPSTPSSVVPTSTSSSGGHNKNRRKSLRRINSDPRNASQLNLEYISNSNQGDDKDEAAGTTAAQQNSQMTTIAASNSDDASIKDAWETATTNAGSQVYNNLVIDRQTIRNCENLDHFWNVFLSDNAQFSLPHFLQGRGDFDLKATNWTMGGDNPPPNAEPMMNRDASSSSSSSRQQQKRVVQYMHPVNVPLAPPQARARKEQTATRYGTSGILIETQTYVDDVPMTDCFYVADRIRVEPSTETDNAVIVTMEFGITFVKSTMFKGIISKKTTSEFSLLFKALADYMSDALVGGTVDLPTMVQKEEETSAICDVVDDDKTTRICTTDTTVETERLISSSQPPQKSTPLHPLSSLLDMLRAVVTPDRIFLGTVLLVQLWVLVELRGIKRIVQAIVEQSMDNNDEHTQGNGQEQCASNTSLE